MRHKDDAENALRRAEHSHVDSWHRCDARHKHDSVKIEKILKDKRRAHKTMRASYYEYGIKIKFVP